MSHDRSVADQIKDVEHRIEMRRERAARHFDEARLEVSRIVLKASAWLPVAAIAGSLAIGFAASRVPSRPAAAPVVKAAARQASTRGILATVVALGAALLRFASSTEARTFWNAFMAFRARRGRGA